MAKVRMFYKRDKDGKFAKVNSLVAKLQAAKAQGVKHTDPGPVPAHKLPKGWHTIKNPAAKDLGKQLYNDKKAGKYKDDGEIFKAAGKLANAYKKSHPTQGQGLSANMIVAAYKQHEYDETGKVILLGEVLGKLDTSKIATQKPTVDKSDKGISVVSNEKFSKPGALKPTGVTLGGANGAQVYEDDKGQKWVVKQPKTGSNAYGNSNFLVDLEIAASRIQNRAGLKVPAAHKETVNGKPAAVSKMYDGATSLFADGSGKEVVDLPSLAPRVVLKLQQQQVLDWLLSNHDSHSGNFLSTDEGIVGIDKGQSFKFFGKDKLHWSYTGTTPLHPNVPVYQTLWKQFIKGEGDLHDPSKGELHTMIQRTMSIPDADYKKLLRPYAEKAAADGKLSAPGATAAERVENFLKLATERKNNLQKDFDNLYGEAIAKQMEEQTKNLSGPSAPKMSANQGAVTGSDLVGQVVQAGDIIPGDWVTVMGSKPHKVLVVNGPQVEIKAPDGSKMPLAPSIFKAGEVKLAKKPPKLNAQEFSDSRVFKEIDSGDLFEFDGKAWEVTMKGKINLLAKPFGGDWDEEEKFPNVAAKKKAAKKAMPKAIPPSKQLKKNQVVKTESQNQNADYDYGKVTGVNASGTIATIKFSNDPDMEYEYHWVNSLQAWIDDPSADPEDQVPLIFDVQSAPAPVPSAGVTGPTTKTGGISWKNESSDYWSSPDSDFSIKLFQDVDGDHYYLYENGKAVGPPFDTLVKAKEAASQSLSPSGNTVLSPPPAPGTTTTGQKAGQPATFDALNVGDVYHIPGGKQQKVIAKTADSFTAQSVSGNTHEYGKDKFDAYAKSKGALLGSPEDLKAGEYGGHKLADVLPGDQFISKPDAFAGGAKTYTVSNVTGDSMTVKSSEGNTFGPYTEEEFDKVQKNWKKLPPKSPWEKYALGEISFEDYQKLTGVDESVKLGPKQGPVQPTVQQIKEAKAPPTWDKIPAEALPIGKEIWERKQQGEFESDSAMWSAIGKALTKWKKANPDVKAPSQNAVRNAARRFEFDKTGAVVWETKTEMTAQQVGNLESTKTVVGHAPKIVRVNKTGKVPLTAFGDVSKISGSYQNPHNFDLDDKADMYAYGLLVTDQKNHGFTPNEYAAVEKYTGGGYSAINSYLRTKKASQYGDSETTLASRVKNIDQAFAKSKGVPDWTIVTRGETGGWQAGIPSGSVTLEELKAQVGKTVVSKSYTSTSMTSRPAFGGTTRIIYRLPPGLKTLWVGGSAGGGYGGAISLHPGEREMILPRNLKYKIVSANKHEDGLGYANDVVVEVVGVGE